MAELVCLICDQCGRIHVDDETSETESCQCSRPKSRMEWATVDQVKQYLRDAARLTSEVSVEEVTPAELERYRNDVVFNDLVMRFRQYVDGGLGRYEDIGTYILDSSGN